MSINLVQKDKSLLTISSAYNDTELREIINEKLGAEDVPSHLYDLKSDTLHRTVRDSQIQKWDEKEIWTGTQEEFELVRDSLPLGTIVNLTNDDDRTVNHTGSLSGQKGYLFDSDALNGNIIRQYKNLSVKEKNEFVITLLPILLINLGLKENTVTYTQLNNEWNKQLTTIKGSYVAYLDYAASTASDSDKQLFGHDSVWYDSYASFIAYNIYTNDKTLIYTKPVIDSIVKFTKAIQNAGLSAAGVTQKKLKSAYTLTTADLGNVARYNSFIELCNQHPDSKFVLIYGSSYNNKNGQYYCYFPKNGMTNLYMTSASSAEIVGNLSLCNDNGLKETLVGTYLDAYQSPNGTTAFSVWNPGTGYNRIASGFTNNTSVIPGNGMGYNSASAGMNSVPVNIFTLEKEDTIYTLYTSLTAWANSKGYYSDVIELPPNFGEVPTISIRPYQMTDYYNEKFLPSIDNLSRKVKRLQEVVKVILRELDLEEQEGNI